MRQLYRIGDGTGRRRLPGVVVRCRSCGMVFKVPTYRAPEAEEYGESYGRDAERYLSAPAARAQFRTALRLAQHELRGTPRLLDLGAGPGELLREAGRLGFKAEGIDACASLVARARSRGLDVRQGLAQEVTAEGLYDVVTAMDIIEHVRDPLRLLGAARRALRPGGRLVVFTPNHRSAVCVVAHVLHRLGRCRAVDEIFGSNHLCFFDDRTLVAILERAGFVVEFMRLRPYDPRRPGQPVSAASLVGVTAIELAGWPFRRVFRMHVQARKPVLA
jgi:SAM-dependent methyltransferase